MAGPPDRQGGPAVTGLRGTRITRPAPDKTSHTHPSPSRLRIPRRAHSNLDEQRRQGDIHASGARTSRGTEPASRGLPDPRRARGLAGRRTGGHGQGQRGLAEREHVRPREHHCQHEHVRQREHRHQVRGTADGEHADATPIDLQPDDRHRHRRLPARPRRLPPLRPPLRPPRRRAARRARRRSHPRQRARPRARARVRARHHRRRRRLLRRPRARRPRRVRRLRRRRRAQRRPPSPPPSTRSSRRARPARRTSPNSA